MARHKWVDTATGSKCNKCGTKIIVKNRPSKKVKGQKVLGRFYQTKGGPVVEGAPGPCDA